MKTLCCAFVLFLCASYGWAQNTPTNLTIGKTPPPPNTTPFRGLPLKAFNKGTCYVLEFWGTWCGPCRQAIPHLNALVTSQKDKKIEFYSIAIQDTEADLKAFLAKTALNTNIVLDTNSATSNAYNIHLLPTTLLIGADGKVAAITAPDRVTPLVLEQLIAGKPLGLPIANLKMADFDWTRKLPTTATSYVWIEESNSASGGTKFPPNSGTLTGDGIEARTIVAVAYNVGYNHTDWRAKMVDNLVYRIAVKAPIKDDTIVREMMRPVIKPLFNLAVRWEEQEKDVYIISTDPSKKLNLSPPIISDEGGARGGVIDWPSLTSEKMVELFTDYCFDVITVDETGLGDKKFSLKLKWIPGNRTSAQKAIEDMGFQVVKGKRKIKMLVVENAS
jgi:uncharacterized protein (TIGR03435 family)